MRHVLVVEVETDMPETAESLANDVAFTMGLGGGVAGGWIGEPEEHAFHRATSVRVYALHEVTDP